MVEAIILDISIIVIAATLLAMVAKVIKQPLIPAYVIAGIIIGPFGLKVITDANLIQNLAELGIALLLFVVGLELSAKRLKFVGKVITTTGIVQILTIIVIGYVTAIWLGFTSTEALYIGLILTFSSTMVVVKLLSDKNKLTTLHGRIMLGILLIQDIGVIIALSFLINFGNFSALALTKTVINGLGLIAIAFLVTRFILPRFFRKIAESDELLLMFAISWLLLFVGLSFYLGFSIAIGAFIAGLSLASFPYNLEIAGRIKPLRDFFVTIFFVSIGMELMLFYNPSILLPIAVFLVIIFFIKPIIIMTITSLHKFSKKTSFLSGNGLAQISEFSIILAVQGVALGHISQDLMSIVIILAVITMTVTTYQTKYDSKIFKRVEKLLFFMKKHHQGLMDTHMRLKNHFILCGNDKMGSRIHETLKKNKEKYIIVDYNPDIINKAIGNREACLYGDVADPEILNKINVKDAKAIISTVPDLDDNLVLLHYLREHSSKAITVLTAKTVDEALDLYRNGANYIILPHVLSGDKASDILQHFMDKRVLEVLREKQIKQLRKLKEELIE